MFFDSKITLGKVCRHWGRVFTIRKKLENSDDLFFKLTLIERTYTKIFAPWILIGRYLFGKCMYKNQFYIYTSSWNI